MSLLFLVVFAAHVSSAQESVPGAASDRALRRSFEAALSGDYAAARRHLPAVLSRPWIGQVNFRAACAFARSLESPDSAEAAALAAQLVLVTGLHNPALALQESAAYLSLPDGRRLFEQFVRAAPDEAVALAAGNAASSIAFRKLLSGAGSSELSQLALLGENSSVPLALRGRMAALSGRIARGELSFGAALRLTGDTPRFFASVVDLRGASGAADARGFGRILENESLMLCRAARENVRTVERDLALFRASDLYILLSLGRAEAPPALFAAIFDRLLLPKWKAESPKAASLLALLDRASDWELRDFAAGAVGARRFDSFLSVAGPEIVNRLFRGVDRASDPLAEAVRLAEILDAGTGPALLRQAASIVSAEFARCRDAGDASGTALYGLLAARLSLEAIAGPYLPFFRSSETLDTDRLFGDAKDCVERHFFYDDEDGVASFDSFLRAYEGDRRWNLEDHGEYVHLTGRGPAGRVMEIFANVPIDAHLPKNREREGEARRRQEAIAAVLKQRGLVPRVIVHRGHSFWVERTLGYVDAEARLVVLGSCGGVTQVHSVIEASHDAQVIATRGVGETRINDSILKALNDRILHGSRIIEWSVFWRELRNAWGASALFRDYLAPNQDPGTVFLRAYYGFMDASN